MPELRGFMLHGAAVQSQIYFRIASKTKQCYPIGCSFQMGQTSLSAILKCPVKHTSRELVK